MIPYEDLDFPVLSLHVYIAVPHLVILSRELSVRISEDCARLQWLALFPLA